MIELNVADYCQDCVMFEADVTNPEVYTDVCGERYAWTNTVIQCANRNKCETIRKHLTRDVERKYRKGEIR